MTIDYAALIQTDRGQPARTIVVIAPGEFGGWHDRQPARVRTQVAAERFTGKTGSHIRIAEEADWHAVAVAAADDPWGLAALPASLPEGMYRLEGGDAKAAALGWMLGQYRFDRYRKADDDAPRVLLTGEPNDGTVRLAEATALVRDLVNTPASDMGPADLEAQASAMATKYGAALTVTRGHALGQGFPMIHTVGQAAGEGREPRLVELEWGDPARPRVAIVGKGVCFDTGGLDIKPSAGMRLMKKDMGGAAHALALAGLVMAAGLKVRLHLLVPAVENSIAGNAFRPGDVLQTRAGLTVENTNTDAEGRLVLGDALTRAAEGDPVLILDFATLTGAARVALGPDLPPLFANDEALAAELVAAGIAEGDPLWRMPLWDGYDDLLKSDVADIVNAPDGGFAGAITAALFLRRFVPAGIAWAHLDVFAWRPTPKPGRPKGGEAYGVRAAYAVLKARYA